MTATPSSQDSPRYFNHRLVGAGAEGVIWRADARTGITPVAIKEYRPGFGHAFYRELRAIQVLDHPNIVRLLDFSNEQDRRRIVWEFCSGGNLRRFISSPGGISPADFHSLFRQLASAVAYLAEMNVVHGDIKPENTLRAHATGPAIWKLGDFGLSSFGHTSRQSRHGTVTYQAPEVPVGRRSTASDIYSLGRTMHDALKATRFRGEGDARSRGALLQLIEAMTEEAPELRPGARVVLSTLSHIEVQGGIASFMSPSTPLPISLPGMEEGQAP